MIEFFFYSFITDTSHAQSSSSMGKASSELWLEHHTVLPYQPTARSTRGAVIQMVSSDTLASWSPRN